MPFPAGLFPDSEAANGHECHQEEPGELCVQLCQGVHPGLQADV